MPPFKCRPRDQWIGWKQELQFTRLHQIANNTRFLILGAPDCFPNLASFTLAAMVRPLSADWSVAYGQPAFRRNICRSIQVLRAYIHGGGLDAVGAHEGLCPRERRYTDPHGVPKDIHVCNCSTRMQAPKTPQQFQSQLLRQDASFRFNSEDLRRTLSIPSLSLLC